MKQLQRQHRIGDPTLDDGQHGPRHDRDDAQADDLPGQPVVLGTAPGGQQHDGHGADIHEGQPEPVNLRRQLMLGQLEGNEAGHPGHDTQRQVDPKHPAPGDRVGEPAAQQRAEHRGHTEHRAHRRHVGGTNPRWDEVAGDGLGQDHEATATQPLDETEEDEGGHGASGAAQGRAQQEQTNGDEVEGLTTDEVGETAIQRHTDGDGQGVRGDDPRHVLDAGQVTDDGRQSGGDDRLVQGGQEHHHHEAEVDDPEPAVRFELGSLRSGSSCRHVTAF